MYLDPSPFLCCRTETPAVLRWQLQPELLHVPGELIHGVQVPECDHLPVAHAQQQTASGLCLAAKRRASWIIDDCHMRCLFPFQLMNSMPPSHLGDFLRRPDVVDDNAELCVIYNNYMKTPTFLETVGLNCVNNVLQWVPNTVAVITSVCLLHRSPCQKQSGGLRCLAFGPWPLAAPRGQRSTDGLTKDLTTTWSSWQRVWSALK